MVKKALVIIEDSEDDRALYRRLLKQSKVHDWQVFEYETAEEGLLALNTNTPDCVLLDYSLPGSDGLLALSQLKQNHPYLPVVMLTGQGNEAIAVSSLKLGAFDYLNKSDITSSLLNRSIEGAINSAMLTKRIAEQEKELKQFARVLAHDFKQPAKAISTMAKLILDEHKGEISAGVIKKLSLISESAEQMSDLVQALICYTQLDQAQPEKQMAKLHHCIEIACNNLITEVEAKQADIELAHLPEVSIVPALAVQLFQILLSNAMLYNEQSPKIFIEAEQTDKYWRVSVKDNGIGIDAKFQQKIFEPLVRLHESDEYKGSGLGLATASRILEKHDGMIECQSNDWGGTTFVISLPR